MEEISREDFKVQSDDYYDLPPSNEHNKKDNLINKVSTWARYQVPVAPKKGSTELL